MQFHLKSSVFRYWVFESWGRTSTVIGSKNLAVYATAEDACTKFHSLYLKKTGNPFGKYSYGLKQPNKFYHLQIDFGITQQMPKAYIETKLSQPIYQLMTLIFDTKHMKQMMLSCDIDLKQMPLGKIASNQINSAMSLKKYCEFNHEKWNTRTTTRCLK